MAVTETAMGLDEYIALVNRYMDRGMTDGWPIIPPSPDAVKAMMASTGRSPAEELGSYQLREKPVTVQDVAIQAVMAGCLPEYFPIVLATVEILMPEAAYRAHSGGWVPWIIVNGPIRRQIGLNCGANLFGPGAQANAAIGRAFDLTLINLAGARTNLWDKSTQGSAYKYGFCIAEDEEHSPWAPLHTTFGFAADESVVTGFADSRHPRHVTHRMSRSPEHILSALADESSTIGPFVVPAKPLDRRNACAQVA